MKHTRARLHGSYTGARQARFPIARGYALIVVLMYAFGHGCTNDLLYPRRSDNTLQGEKIVEPVVQDDRPETVESALGFLAKLVESDFLHRELVETALGLALHLDPTVSATPFKSYRYKCDKPASSVNLIKEIDFRTSVPPDKMGDGFLIIYFEPTTWLNATAILDHYGWPNLGIDASAPEEDINGEGVIYLDYLLEKWKVSFAIGPPPQEVLVKIILEWPEQQDLELSKQGHLEK